MQFPLSWLNEFIKVTLAPPELSELLTLAGLEVDSIAPTPLSFEGVVAAEVLSCEQHPDADRLQVAQVSDGSETVQVVCGGANCRTGIKVALAKVGARLDGGDFKIKKGKIRGVESFGMLCAEEELGFADKSEGIMELPADTPLGANLTELYGDLIAEISLTPNLGHCNSVLGVARELAALTDEALSIPTTKLNEGSDPITAQVKVQESELCSRYTCRVIKGVRVGPTPAPLKRRLEACGLRSINNVVDATNLTMLELGHPLHAFDLNKLSGAITVKMTEGETLTTLDGEERKLPKGTLTICDDRGPIAIAGVMGGANSEVSEGTVDILVEAAHFAPFAVRRASRDCAISTESSKRFERGTDPNMIPLALDRCCALIAELAGGQISQGIIDLANGDFPRAKVAGRLSHTNRLLGTQLGRSEVEDLLKRLEFEVSWKNEDHFHCKVPTYRTDVSREVDLIEEVGRLYGFQNIPKKRPSFKSAALPHTAEYLVEREMRRRLIGEGLQEMVSGNLVSEQALHHFPNPALPESTWVRVLNPSSVEQAVMRTSLLPTLLQAVARNAHHGEHDLACFEIGRVHFKTDDQFQEQPVCAILLTGQDADFVTLKGIVENLLEGLHTHPAQFENNNLEVFHPGRQARIVIDGVEVGTLGEIHPATARRFDVERPTLAATLSLVDLMEKRQGDPQMSPLPTFPGSERDWTVTLDESTSYGSILEAIDTIPSRLLQKVGLLDIYRSATIGAGKKNVTLRFLYRDAKKTLSVKAVEAEHERIVRGVQQTLGVESS